MEDVIWNILQNYGLAGLVIFALGIALIYIYRKGEDKDNRLEEKNKIILDLAERGIAALERVEHAIDNNNKIIKEFPEILVDKFSLLISKK